MNKLAIILGILFVLVVGVRAEEMDMDGRIIPTFTIPKGDTNWNLERQNEIKKITLNDSSITLKREMVKVKNPTYKITSIAMNGEVKNIGLE